jgi:glycosyltransferase involved in cell wall biosynthesis
VHTIALFFTRNISLELWVETGLFDREKQLYEEHLRRGHLQKVYWLTYGRNDAELAERLKSSGRLHPDVEVLSMSHFPRGKWGCLLYSFLMPLLHRHSLQAVDILKTNQMDGSWSAVIAKWLYKKPLIVRTGYTASIFIQRQSKSKIKKKIYEWMEHFAYRYADIGVVASYHDKQYVCSKYRISRGKIEVLYNYINTAIFRPTNCEKYTDRMIFVGRLDSQKNLFSLLDAVSKTEFTLDIYGKGELRDELERKVRKLNIEVNFMGVVPNHELPQVLNRYRYYILPSLYEGMPKTLLEAMACGLVCIGTNVEGINEVIEDGVNGYLAEGTQAQALVEVIKRATQLPHDSVTAEGIRKIRNNFSLEAAVEQEKEIIMKLKT